MSAQPVNRPTTGPPEFDDARARQMFRARFEESPLPQGILGPDGVIRRANSALGELLGRSVEDLIGRRPRELRHESDRGGADATLAALLSGELSRATAERIYAHTNGDPLPTLIHLNVIWTDDGRVEGVNTFFQDLRILRASERRLELQEQFYAALGQRGGEFAHVLDADGMFVYVSPAVKRLFGYDPEFLVGRYAYQEVHPDDMAEAQAKFAAVVRDGGTAVHQFRVRRADGQWRWVQNTLTNMLRTPVGGIVCNLIDVTERREAEAQLRIAQLRNQAIVETTREGIWIAAPGGRTEFANQRMAEILGRPLSDLYELDPEEMLADNEALVLRTRLRERWERGDEEYELDYERPDGSRRRLLVAAAPFALADGAFLGSLAMVHDVTEQRRMEEELRRAALHDPLTGLPNRTLLGDRLEQALIRQTEAGGSVALLFIDLDHFKFVNDSRGHDVGDQVLVTVADRLRALVRPQETVARLGGDEFVVLCTCDDEVGPDDVADRISEALAEPIVLDTHQVSLTASVGIASSPPYSGADLLRYADTAMFAAKSAGRAQVRTFDRSLAEETERTYALAGDLRAALEQGGVDGLAMHYQPVVELATGHVIGYEALARWAHREHGPIPPTVFVPIAEQMGLARVIDRWAVQRATADLDAMRAAATVADEAYVAVNLSALHLAERDLEETIVAATEAAGLPPGNICLEITEGAVMRDVAATVQVLESLRHRGYRIAIDDFGIGQSSLAYLRNFPITALKVDRAFVKDMTEDEDAYSIVTSIVALARAIGVTTIAEGVETPEQAQHLRHLGCVAAQGWLWSRAVPLDEITPGSGRFPAAAAGPPRKRWARRPEEQQIRDEHGLARLLEMQREGASLATIAAALNSEGFRAPTGQRWHRVSVARALRDLAARTERA